MHNLRKPVSALLATFLLLAGVQAAAAGQAAGPEPSTRDVIAHSVRLATRSPFPPERVKAIRAIGGQSDKKLIDEFKVLDLLVAIAQDTRRLAVERNEALDALVQLYRKGIGSSKTMEFLTAIVNEEAKGATKIVRMKALMLIAEMAGTTKDERISHMAFAALEKIWKNRSRNKIPVRMLAAVIETMGGFTDNERAMTMLQNGLGDKSAVIRAGAQRGLQRYLRSAKKIDRRLSSKIFLLFNKAQSVDERVALIHVIDQMVMIDPKILANARSIKTKLLALLQAEGGYGTDAEVRAAVRVLLQIADDNIVQTLLAAGKPARERKWTFATYRDIGMALISVVNGMRPDLRKSKVTAAQKATAARIADYYLWLLNPKWLAGDPTKKGDFAVLVQGAVICLGMWPVDFDRQKIVSGLIMTLKTVSENDWEDMVKECEKSLVNLANIKAPFRLMNKGQDRPDIQAWRDWYRKYKEYLAAGKEPLDAQE